MGYSNLFCWLAAIWARDSCCRLPPGVVGIWPPPRPAFWYPPPGVPGGRCCGCIPGGPPLAFIWGGGVKPRCGCRSNFEKTKLKFVDFYISKLPWSIYRIILAGATSVRTHIRIAWLLWHRLLISRLLWIRRRYRSTTRRRKSLRHFGKQFSHVQLTLNRSQIMKCGQISQKSWEKHWKRDIMDFLFVKINEWKKETPCWHGAFAIRFDWRLTATWSWLHLTVDRQFYLALTRWRWCIQNFAL